MSAIQAWVRRRLRRQVVIIVSTRAARLAPRWLPANVQLRLAKGCLSMRAKHRVSQADRAIVEEAGGRPNARVCS